jgi:hypothetical protein
MTMIWEAWAGREKKDQDKLEGQNYRPVLDFKHDSRMPEELFCRQYFNKAWQPL